MSVNIYDKEGRQFVDTNIILYAYDCSDPVKHRTAAALLNGLWDTGLGCLSIQVLQELYVNLTGKIPNKLSPETAGKIVSDLGRWRHHTPGLDSLLEAVDIQQHCQISFWDAMIICSAIRQQCTCIWTEDLNHTQDYYGIKVLDPFA